MIDKLGALLIGGICAGLPLFVIGINFGAHQERDRLIEVGIIQERQQAIERPWKQGFQVMQKDIEVAHARVEAVKFVMDIVAKSCTNRARAPRVTKWPKRANDNQ